MTRAALAKIGDQVSIGTLRRALADGDPATQTWAIRNLGQLRDHQSIDPLIAALDSPNDRLTRAAATALAKLGDPRALAPSAAPTTKRPASPAPESPAPSTSSNRGWRAADRPCEPVPS